MTLRNMYSSTSGPPGFDRGVGLGAGDAPKGMPLPSGMPSYDGLRDEFFLLPLSNITHVSVSGRNPHRNIADTAR